MLSIIKQCFCSNEIQNSLILHPVGVWPSPTSLFTDRTKNINIVSPVAGSFPEKESHEKINEKLNEKMNEKISREIRRPFHLTKLPRHTGEATFFFHSSTRNIKM